MNKYKSIFKNYFSTEIHYRANSAGVLVLELLSVTSIVILWTAIFEGKTSIAGLTLNDTILYYMLVPLVGTLTQVTVSDVMANEIRWGRFNKYLLKPYNIVGDCLMRLFAGKLNYVSITFPIYVVALTLFSIFTHTTIKLSNIFMALVIIVAVIALHFAIDTAITWVAFWLDDVWTLKHFKNVLFIVVGGRAFPLEYVPQNWRYFFNFLPFKYMYYIPVSYLSGKRDTSHLLEDFTGIILWSIVFIFIAKILWHFGIRKYGAYGG